MPTTACIPDARAVLSDRARLLLTDRGLGGGRDHRVLFLHGNQSRSPLRLPFVRNTLHVLLVVSIGRCCWTLQFQLLRARTSVRQNQHAAGRSRAAVLPVVDAIVVIVGVAGVPGAVAIEVGLGRIGGDPAVVVLVQDRIAVDVRVARVADSIPVDVRLVGIRQGGAVVGRVVDAVTVRI